MQAVTSEKARQLRRRAVRLTVLLPFVLAILLIFALTLIAAVTGRAAPIANIFLTLLLLCPLAICGLPIYLILLVLVVLMGRANEGVGDGLARVNRATIAAGNQVTGLTQRAARATIGFNSRFAALDRAVTKLFDKPKREDQP